MSSLATLPHVGPACWPMITLTSIPASSISSTKSSIDRSTYAALVRRPIEKAFTFTGSTMSGRGR